jgi:hypothetical protein
VPQEHLPAEVAGERFYTPSAHGAEPQMSSAHEARQRHQGEEPRRDDDE